MHTLRLKIRSLMLAALLQFGIGAAFAGTLTIVGTGDGLGVLTALAEAYGKKYPGAGVQVPPSIGSGGAIAAVGSDREVMGRVARSLTSNEISSGIRYQPIFTVPSAFYVHPGVPVRRLSAAQLQGIFSGKIVSWQEVGGPDQRIRVVRREDADSSVLVFRAAIPEFRDIRFTDRSKLALTTQEATASIKENPGAIGFGSYSAVLARELGVVTVDGNAPTDKNYPAKVTLALIFKPHNLSGEIGRFLDYLGTDAAHATMISFGARPVEQ